MSRTGTGVRDDAATRLSRLVGRDPEWGGWIALLEIALRSSGEDGSYCDVRIPVGASSAASGGVAPLLEGCELRVDAERVRRLLGALIAVTPSSAGLRDYAPQPADVLDLLSASLRQDEAAEEGIAARAGVPARVLRAVASLVAWPVLQACGRQLTAAIPASWQHGYCPVCGAWPLLAELRGLERARRLRCGRCSADWALPWLLCAYCGERDHELLGSLVADGQADGRKVETCGRCRGYLKTVSSLGALTPSDLMLTDLETVELDLAARERGWERPDSPPFILDLTLAPRQGSIMRSGP